MPVFEHRNDPAPDLHYIILPPYEVPDLIVIGGVVVENRGKAAANNIKISLEYDDTETAKIRHLQVISDVDYILRGGGDLHSFATLRVRRLEPEQKVFIYFSGPNRILPRVIVTHYEGAG